MNFDDVGFRVSRDYETIGFSLAEVIHGNILATALREFQLYKHADTRYLNKHVKHIQKNILPVFASNSLLAEYLPYPSTFSVENIIPREEVLVAISMNTFVEKERFFLRPCLYAFVYYHQILLEVGLSLYETTDSEKYFLKLLYGETVHDKENTRSPIFQNKTLLQQLRAATQLNEKLEVLKDLCYVESEFFLKVVQ